MSNPSIILIEDQDLYRMTIRSTLQFKASLQVIAEAATGAEGLKLVEKHRPDLVIVDVGLPDIDGIEVTRRIKEMELAHSPIKVLILTLRDNEDVVLAAFGAGADSYCMKDSPPEMLVEAVQITAEGYSWIDPAIASIVLEQARQIPISTGESLFATAVVEDSAIAVEAEAPTPSPYPLTERELEVLQLIVDGYSNAKIATELFITVGTVKTHVRSILNKLCADDRTQAAVRALRTGLVR
jgi:DNA-binding NarL/FixJ family response regulator